jgi:threonine/homoserine/homoserine lactone efflux protein
MYLLAVITLLGIPGPTNTLLAVAGASSGLLRSLPLLVAEALGYLISAGIVGLVIVPAIADIRWLAVGLKLAVAVYLLWAAAALWRRSSVAGGAPHVTFAGVFIATLLNPKALALALGIVPWASPDLIWSIVTLLGVIGLTGVAWIVGGAALAAAAGRHAGLLPRAGSIALVGFAGLLVASAFG